MPSQSLFRHRKADSESHTLFHFALSSPQFSQVGYGTGHTPISDLCVAIGPSLEELFLVGDLQFDAEIIELENGNDHIPFRV